MSHKFNMLVLSAAAKAGPNSHAAKIYGVIEENGKPGFSRVYTAIDRLAMDGLLSETCEDGDTKRWRLFTVSAAGRAALAENGGDG